MPSPILFGARAQATKKIIFDWKIISFFLFVDGNFVSRFNDYFLAFEYYKAEFNC